MMIILILRPYSNNLKGLAKMRTSNPALNENVFSGVGAIPSGEVMTIEGTVNKVGISLFLTILAACYGWMKVVPADLATGGASWQPILIISMLVGIGIAIALYFSPKMSPYLTPAYAITEGFLLGVISAITNSFYPGIVFQAVGLTFAVLFAMLMAYKSGLIRVTDRFRKVLFAATGGILLFYLASMGLSFFGINGPTSFLAGNSMMSIGFSLFVVGIASFNLTLDFDFIENAAASGRAPKYMEWYGAFGLLVTLVWLYFEILRLLMKLQSRD